MFPRLPPTFAKEQHSFILKSMILKPSKPRPPAWTSIIPERTTFYGSREIGIKDPAGHFITFAHFEKPA